MISVTVHYHMKQKTQFYLARHGETEWNRLRKLQGRLDSPLTSLGLQQARVIAEQFARDEIQLILSSPLKRAFDTAKICQQHLNLEHKTHVGLIERDFGEWQSYQFDELTNEINFEAVFKQVTASAPPGGESGLNCANRLSETLQSIADNYLEERVLVITHGDAIRCFMDLLSESVEVDAYSQYGNGRIIPVDFNHADANFKLPPCP